MKRKTRRRAPSSNASLIRHYPEAERPRERLERVGPDALSVRELVAVLIGTGPRGEGCLGLAARLVANDADELRALSVLLSGRPEFRGIRGLGPAGRARLLAAFELARRHAATLAARRRYRATRGIGVAAKGLRQVPFARRHAAREWLGFVPIRAGGIVEPLVVVSEGSEVAVNTDERALFAAILALRPAGILLVHNHPSGDLNPSRGDLDVTERVESLCGVFSLALIGHWIVGPNGERRVDLPG